jgi:hypothetical protein
MMRSTDVPVPVDACNTLSVRLWNDQQPARYYYGSFFASLFGRELPTSCPVQSEVPFTHVYLFTLFFVREVIIKMEDAVKKTAKTLKRFRYLPP